MLLCVLVSGCASTPLSKQASPAFEMPQRFAFSGEAPLQQRWWQAFDDPALNGLVKQALTHSFTLQSAYARVQQARASVASQRAALFPTLDAVFGQSATRQASSNQFRTSAGGATVTPNRSNSNWSETRSFQFTAAYELDVWGRLRNTRNAAVFDARASQSALQSAAISLAADIATNWYQLQELRERIALLKGQAKTNKDVLKLTTFAFAHGQAAAADVLRQRQTVESVGGQLEQAQASADVIRHALAVLVGQAPEQFKAPTGTLAGLPPLPDTGVPAALLMRRPDVREQYFALAAADRRVAVAVADRFPRLELSAGAFTTTDTAALFSTWVVQLAANLTQPLFDGGLRAAEVDRSKAVVSEEVANYQQTLLVALQEVEDALSNEYRQQRFLKRLDKQLALSKQAVDNLRLRYLRGATNYLDVLDALLTRQQLQVDRIAGQRQLLDFRINLYRALAGGLPDDNLGHIGTANKGAS